MAYEDNPKTTIREPIREPIRTTSPSSTAMPLIVGGLVVAVAFILWLAVGYTGGGDSAVPAGDTTNVTVEPPATPADTNTNTTIDPAPEAAPADGMAPSDGTAPADPVNPTPPADPVDPAPTEGGAPATPPANP
jgi:hypothetical protein